MCYHDGEVVVIRREFGLVLDWVDFTIRDLNPLNTETHLCFTRVSFSSFMLHYVSKKRRMHEFLGLSTAGCSRPVSEQQ